MDHRRAVVAAAGTLFGLLAGHTVIEVTRDAIFLTRLSAAELPTTYLLIAAFASAAALVDQRLLERFEHRLPAFTLLFGAGGAVVFYFLLDLGAGWVPRAFYIWEGMIATLAVAQFWRLLSGHFTVSEAKRIYTRIAAFGSLGAVAGAASAELALRWVDPRSLLWVGAAMYVLTGTIPRRLEAAREAPPGALRDASAPNEEDAVSSPSASSEPPPAPRPSRPPSSPRARLPPRARAYLPRLLALMVFTAVVGTMVDFIFKSTVDDAIANEGLGAFFSRFYLGLNAFSLLVQLFVAPPLLRTLGVTRGLLVLPLLLLFGASAVALTGGVWIALALRGADGSLRNSLHRSTLELLWFPLSQGVRGRFKPLLDAIGQRAGQASGSLLILGGAALGAGAREMAFAVAALATAWLGLAFTMRRRYLDLFRSNLRAGRIETRVEVPELDLGALESLIASLNSEHDDEVLASLQLIADYDRGHLVPGLLLHHPSSPVVVRTLEILAESGRTDFVPAARRLLDHASPDVQGAAMQALVFVLSPEELRAETRRACSPSATAAALVALAARDADVEGASRSLHEAIASGSPELRVGLARAVGRQGDARLAAELHAMIPHATRDPRLQCELAKSFGQLRDTRAIGFLIRSLAARGSRIEARAALLAIGEPALVALAAALDDGSLPRDVRAHLPGSMSPFASRDAARLLFERLRHEPDTWVRYKILRALRSLADRLPGLSFDARGVTALARAELARATRHLQRRLALSMAHEQDDALRAHGGELLAAILREKEQQALNRAVRLVVLSRPSEDLRGLTHALESGDRRLRAESRELLSHVADPSIERALIALLDDVPDEERLARAESLLGLNASHQAKDATTTYDAVVAELASDDSVAVRTIATDHAAVLARTETRSSRPTPIHAGRRRTTPRGARGA